jgi:ribose-phosphate pyrophosphokinase
MSFRNYWKFEELFDTMQFPAGESHVRLNLELLPSEIDILCSHVRDFNGLMNVVVANEILARDGVQAKWVMPYFPFARMDRRLDSHEGMELTFAMNAVADLDVTIFDPHSDVSGLIKHITQGQIVEAYTAAGLFGGGDVVVAIPDAGAIKKADGWISGRESVQCLKKRDMRTGKLSGFEVLADDLTGKTMVIVDDLCDAGGTFLGLAAAMQDKGATKFRLAVTHGLFTKGLDHLTSTFDKIYTLDTCPLVHENLVTVSTELIYRSCVPV